MSLLIRGTGETRRSLSRGTSIRERPEKIAGLCNRQSPSADRLTFLNGHLRPVYSVHHGLSTQVLVGIDEGLKHDSSLHCDELVSLPKSVLTNFVGRLTPQKLATLSKALCIALDIPE